MGMQERCEGPERMESFFDLRAAGYEQHMAESVEDLDAFYHSIAHALPFASEAPRILDLGIGTGLELHALFERFPAATVTGIDLSQEMLAHLQRKEHDWTRRVELVQGSFLEIDLGASMYDGVISAMALHHWVPAVKLDLYRRVHRALKAGGGFVNGDYVESPGDVARRLSDVKSTAQDERHHDHIDLPLTCEMEVRLLEAAGFGRVDVAFRRARTATLLAIA